MFNPAQFKTYCNAPIICNSAHPCAKYIESLVFKKIPRKKLFYVRLLNDKGVVTYRQQDHSLMLWTCPFNIFKQAWEHKVPSKFVFDAGYICSEVYDVSDTDKYIGNTVYQLIQDYDVFR